MISLLAPHIVQLLSTTRMRPVCSTEAAIVSISSGASHTGSITSAVMPTCSSRCLARNASTTMWLIATIVTSLPSVRTRAWPGVTAKGSSGYDAGILIEHAMLHHHDWVVVADRGDRAALGVMRCSGRHDFEARHMHEIRMESLAVLGALPPGAADDGTLDNRHRDCAGKHVRALRRDVDELVHA